MKTINKNRVVYLNETTLFFCFERMLLKCDEIRTRMLSLYFIIQSEKNIKEVYRCPFERE